jgi:hypothetical protein
MTNNGTGWGGFDFTIDYLVDREQVGALIVCLTRRTTVSGSTSAGTPWC